MLGNGFGPYGRYDELVLATYEGEQSAPPGELWNVYAEAAVGLHPGLQGVAPYHSAELPQNSHPTGTYEIQGGLDKLIQDPMRVRLVEWLLESCRIAGLRGVRIHAILFQSGVNRFGLQDLEDCIDAAGGNPNVDEAQLAPTKQMLDRYIAEYFADNARLVFLN